tara:strand:- start:28510 stop:29676 length:1167 start_codon:yes stop_codon:yes gene_type:complete
MPGYELVGKEEQEQLNEIFKTSNGVLFAHGFNNLRNNRFRVREFENKFSSKIGSKFTQATTSGTVAQAIAMLAMGVGKGDEVITQSHTFVATVESILAIGATPVLVDIDETYNMCPISLENAITNRTKLIVPVHMLGNPARMNEIQKIADKYDLAVLEDACEALGAKYDGKYVGTISEAGIFSLDFAKTITTGEGGLIITDDEKIYKYCKEYHDHGHESNPNYPRGRDTRSLPGMNYRMSEMQGAVGLAQLKKLDFIVSKSRENKKIIKDNINNGKIKFRELTDEDGDLGDTLIFNFSNKNQAKAFLKKYNEMGYFTKNIPDAIDWHFAGTWNHMFKEVDRYKDTWHYEWDRSTKLLERSISIPIYIKSSYEDLEQNIQSINKALDQI